MTKTQFKRLVLSRWDGVSNLSIGIKEGEVILLGLNYIHASLYKPQYHSRYKSSESSPIVECHNLRVKAVRKFEKWLWEICKENNLPWKTFEQYTQRILELIP